PFIITTSYPHEILHNWWGNGVYVDYPSGNWCEGLTAYMADHLLKEGNGRGADYRIQTLQKYADYAATKRDFPLSQFRSRHSSATEAVGYGKALMFYHMLRLELGDEVFTKALQTFYANNRFKTASYDDLRLAMEQTSGRSLRLMFDQWVNRIGAPTLKIENAMFKREKDKYKITFELIQTQDGEAYQLQIPLAITLVSNAQALETRVEMNQKQQQFEIEVDTEPLRLDIDPGFDLFRKLDRAEMPPAFTKLFGSQELLIVIPANAGNEMAVAYNRFAQDLSQSGPERVEIVNDDKLNQLPKDKAVALLGWENRFLPVAQETFSSHGIKFSKTSTQIDGKPVARTDHAIAIVTRRGKSQQPLALIAADGADALPGLGRKLPHYHKYSYLAFEGPEPQNRLKGRWPVTDSPMTVFFQPGSARAKLPKRKPLAVPPPLFNSERMMKTVSYLASESLQGRGFGSQELDLAADYIAQAFQEAGLQPLGDQPGSFFQVFSANGGEKEQQAMLKNVIGLIPSNNPKQTKESLIIGAHYDHLGLGWPDVRDDNHGQVHYGADDNASGIAVLIELARVMGKSLNPERNIIFVAFSGEEAGRLGSRHYVANARSYPISEVIAMINLDTVGRLSDGKLLVLGGESASEWVHIFRGIGFVTGINTTLVKEELDSSDQVSFLRAGVPAVQLFTGANPDYHRPSDTKDKIDTKGMLQVATVTKEVIEYLANREEPLTSSLANKREEKQSKKSSRKVTLGTIPDFSFAGPGYRLKGVTPGSPAAKAGLRKGDVIIRMKEQPIDNLRQVSQVLKSSQPGDRLKLTFRRGNENMVVEVELKTK
ncbi:MAG: M20/M25/M40 family metallo-hydrolase, partial [Gammaproteobacteria bacterium]